MRRQREGPAPSKPPGSGGEAPTAGMPRCSCAGLQQALRYPLCIAPTLSFVCTPIAVHSRTVSTISFSNAAAPTPVSRPETQSSRLGKL